MISQGPRLLYQGAMQTRRAPLATLAPVGALLAALAVAGCAGGPEHRYFQPTADQIGPNLNSYGEAVVPRHGLIVVQGDDFAYGLARGRSRHLINGAPEGQASITISQALRKVLKGVRVENRGYPGDTVAMSTLRWSGAAPADLTILTFTYGDAAASTDLDDFKGGVAALIQAARAHGGAVFLVVPPPSRDELRDHSQGEYRDAARSVAQSAGVQVFDAFAAMDRLKVQKVKTVAQPTAIYQGVAADMSAYIKVVTPVAAEPEQTGQAGSGDSRTVRVSPASAS